MKPLKNNADRLIDDQKAKLFDNLEWLLAKEAAIYLRTSVGQIRNMVYRKQLAAYKPNGKLLFRRRDLDSFIENSLIEQRSFL